MLASKMRWDVQTPDKEKVEQLAGRLGITPLAASLLVMRPSMLTPNFSE